MSRYRGRLTPEAVEDLKRLQAFRIEQDLSAAQRALGAVARLLLRHVSTTRRPWPAP